MKLIKIEKQQWAEGLEKLKGSYQVFGPVRDNDSHNFKPLNPGEMPDLKAANTRLSPKSIIYPQSEIMFRYALDETAEDANILKEIDVKNSPRAVVGIRPCDAYAFLLVKRNFDTPEYQDPYWNRAYAATTLVGLACQDPCRTCFCTSAGCGPFHEDGLDVLLIESGEEYLAKAVTSKGKALLEAGEWKTETETDQPEAMKQNAEAKIVSAVATAALRKQETTGLFNAPFWEEVAFACINCGTCTYVCPTCWCFDIQDESRRLSGLRIRNWDSCMFPLFTLHGSGHNPRDKKVQRVRQRFMHKLKYYVDKYENGIQCVGCGRCIRSCPVNIDITRVCNLMNSYDSSRGNP